MEFSLWLLAGMGGGLASGGLIYAIENINFFYFTISIGLLIGSVGGFLEWNHKPPIKELS